MNDQYHQPSTQRIRLAERGGHFRVAIAEKVVVGIHHRVIVLRLIQHRVFAARRNYYVFDAVTVQIAEHGLNLGHQGELVAKLLVQEFVIDPASGRFRLSETWDRSEEHTSELQ